ncbi:MAG: hypothetical protein Q9227_000267 [Pyrenula ochraceoflavens]
MSLDKSYQDLRNDFKDVYDDIGGADPQGTNWFISQYKFMKKKPVDIMAILNIVLGALSVLIPVGFMLVTAMRFVATATEVGINAVNTVKALKNTLVYEFKAMAKPKQLDTYVGKANKGGFDPKAWNEPPPVDPPKFTNVPDLKADYKAKFQDREYEPRKDPDYVMTPAERDDDTLSTYSMNSLYVNDRPDKYPTNACPDCGRCPTCGDKPPPYNPNDPNPVGPNIAPVSKPANGRAMGGMNSISMIAVGTMDMQLGASIIGGDQTMSQDQLNKDTLALQYLCKTLFNSQEANIKAQLSGYFREVTKGKIDPTALQALAQAIGGGAYTVTQPVPPNGKWTQTKFSVGLQAVSHVLGAIWGSDATFRRGVILAPWGCSGDDTAKNKAHDDFWDMLPGIDPNNDGQPYGTPQEPECAYPLELQDGASETYDEVGCWLMGWNNIFSTIKGLNLKTMPPCKSDDTPSPTNNYCVTLKMIIDSVLTTGWANDWKPLPDAVFIASQMDDFGLADNDHPYPMGHWANLLSPGRYPGEQIQAPKGGTSPAQDWVKTVMMNLAATAYDAKFADTTKNYPFRPREDFPPWWDWGKRPQDCQNPPDDWTKSHQTWTDYKKTTKGDNGE